jgi:hypothetical protein
VFAMRAQRAAWRARTRRRARMNGDALTDATSALRGYNGEKVHVHHAIVSLLLQI